MCSELRVEVLAAIYSGQLISSNTNRCTTPIVREIKDPGAARELFTDERL